ncbi:hypothetical protein LZ554_005887 [Drepanopeziza brunnea f. sp. 'monogermtubi']|nr:hypothetical protein LZ554_005887 [Drepanopeziza brunnea f. sp. 'monogermtubi']
MTRYTFLALAYAATLIAADEAPTPTYTPVYTPIYTPIPIDTPIYTPDTPIYTPSPSASTSASASNILTIQTDTILTLPSLTPSLAPTSIPSPAVPTPSGGFGNATSTLTGTALMPVMTGGAAGRMGMGMGVFVVGVVGVVGGFVV